MAKINTVTVAHQVIIQQARKDLSKMSFPMTGRSKAERAKNVDIRTVFETFQRLPHHYQRGVGKTSMMTRTKRCACHEK